MASLVLRDLFDGPGMEAVRIVRFQIRHVARRVVLGVAVFGSLGPLEELAQRLHTRIRSFGESCLFVAKLGDVPRLHHGKTLRAVALTNGVEDAAPNSPRFLTQREKRGRGVIELTEPAERG